MRMIVIQDATVVEVDKMCVQFAHPDTDALAVYPGDKPDRTVRLTKETVQLRVFACPGQPDVAIGWTKEVGAAVGWPLESWHDAAREIEQAHKTNTTLLRAVETSRKEGERLAEVVAEQSRLLVRLNDENQGMAQNLDTVQTAPWWRRLAWLFTGVKW